MKTGWFVIGCLVAFGPAEAQETAVGIGVVVNASVERPGAILLPVGGGLPAMFRERPGRLPLEVFAAFRTPPAGHWALETEGSARVVRTSLSGQTSGPSLADGLLLTLAVRAVRRWGDGARPLFDTSLGVSGGWYGISSNGRMTGRLSPGLTATLSPSTPLFAVVRPQVAAAQTRFGLEPSGTSVPGRWRPVVAVRLMVQL